MPVIEFGRRRVFILLASIGFFVLLFNVLSLTGDEAYRITNIDVPGRPIPPPAAEQQPDFKLDEDDEDIPELEDQTLDSHPISKLKLDADRRWREYEGQISHTFGQTVKKYRSRYERHPPPGFKTWYKFARERNVFNIDDFEQVMDDLRPFWAIEPMVLRQYAAHMWEDDKHGISGIHIRNHKVVRLTNPGWRSENLKKLIEVFVKHLPDMDIAMNRLDQPRLVVPWKDMQALLAKEYESRVLMVPPGVVDKFTEGQEGLLNTALRDPKNDSSVRLDAEWTSRPGKQYMELASLACPPESPARSNMSLADADALYKHSLGGLVTNFNLSSDLCIVGPALQNLHGFLYASTSLLASKKLLPVFGECKVNVNSDILFPANKYYEKDQRYDYSPEEDLPWEDKKDMLLWLGVTSGGIQTADNWSTMHRQRLVRLLNGTYMSAEGKEVMVMRANARSPEASAINMTYENFLRFQPSLFAEQHADVGFVQAWGCFPGDCPFYTDVFEMKPQVSLSSQFRNKYLIDVDGHSFSGRWHAFLESKSLGFKATIFREWHDSRLFAWRHFIPVDNRYDDLYSLLTYFIGYGTPPAQRTEEESHIDAHVYMPSHEREGEEIARQARDWAKKALRREDIEVYMFRLLLEYGRLIDDNRDHIGYSGDGSELDKFMDGAQEGWGKNRWGLGRIFGNKEPPPPAK